MRPSTVAYVNGAHAVTGFSRQEKYLNNATLWEAAAEGDVKGESPRGNAFSAANTAP